MTNNKLIGKCNICGKDNVEIDLDFGGCVECAKKYADWQRKHEKTAKIYHDIEHKAIAIKFKEGKHIGVSEELNFLGVTIIIDRNKSGRVMAMEILY